MENHYWAFLNKNKRLYWKGFSNSERHNAINEIKRSINKYGYITDFKMFSDLETSFTIDIEESKIDGLYKALIQNIALKDIEKVNSDSIEIRSILLNVSFSKGTGNLENIIPSVPG